MICPHCRATVRRKERTGGECGHCRRRFALDPREHGTGMNDLRIERLVHRLTDGGRLRVTLTQLWYLARTGNPARQATTLTYSTVQPSWVRWLAIVPMLTGLLVLVGAVLAGLLERAIARHQVGVWVVALVLGYLVVARCPAMCRWVIDKCEDFGGKRTARTSEQPARAEVVPSYEAFRSMMIGRWTQVYGGLPAGIMDDGPYTGSAPRKRPRAVLLSLDRSVTAFLNANGLPGRLDLALAATTEDLADDDVPVVVLHDVGVQGALLAPELRAARPERVVVDVAPPVRRVMHSTHAVRLHTEPAGDARSTVVARLCEEAGLTLTEAEWLAAGWWSPLAAIPPVLLESVVERAVERALELDRVRHAAASVGFLTWPEPSGTSSAQDGSTG